MALMKGFFFGGGADRDAEIEAMLAGGALVVDVRTPREFAGGRAERAVNIPYDVIVEEIGAYAPDKEQAIVLYCHSGTRASTAKKALLRAGYTHVANAFTLRNIRKLLRRQD